jgi:hypothetical protein
MRYGKFLLVSLFTFLFACTATVSPTGVPTLPVLTHGVPSQPLGDDILAIYHKSGGIAGIDETLTIHQGGLLELTGRDGNTKSIQVDEPIIQALRRMLEQKEFSELAPLYQGVGADLFTYTITARDLSGNPKTVTTMDAAKHPDYLGLLIIMLDQLRGHIR